MVENIFTGAKIFRGSRPQGDFLRKTENRQQKLLPRAQNSAWRRKISNYSPKMSSFGQFLLFQGAPKCLGAKKRFLGTPSPWAPHLALSHLGDFTVYTVILIKNRFRRKEMSLHPITIKMVIPLNRQIETNKSRFFHKLILVFGSDWTQK